MNLIKSPEIEDLIKLEKKIYPKEERLLRKEPNYKKAYTILIDYFDSIPDEDKPEVDKRLKGCGL